MARHPGTHLGGGGFQILNNVKYTAAVEKGVSHGKIVGVEDGLQKGPEGWVWRARERKSPGLPVVRAFPQK